MSGQGTRRYTRDQEKREREVRGEGGGRQNRERGMCAWRRRGTMQQRDYHENGARSDIELITCYLHYQDFRFTLSAVERFQERAGAGLS